MCKVVANCNSGSVYVNDIKTIPYGTERKIDAYGTNIPIFVRRHEGIIKDFFKFIKLESIAYSELINNYAILFYISKKRNY